MNPLMVVGFGLAGIGVILSVIFGIILMVRAFQTSVAWGLVYLFLFGIGPMVFVAKHWPVAGKPFLKAIASGAMAGVGMALIMMGSPGQEVPRSKETEDALRSLPETPVEVQPAPQ